MFALAAVAAAHGSVQSSEVLLIIGAVAVAAFWKSIVKVAIALLGIAIVVMIVDGAAAIASILHH